jgi:hypothetical protein
VFGEAALEDRFESVPFCLHSNVTIVLEHLLRDVSRDIHNGLVANCTLCEFGNQSVLGITKPALYVSPFLNVFPSRLQRLNRPRRA